MIIGGEDRDICFYRDMTARLGIDNRAHFRGPRSLDRLGAYLAQADILISPRSQGCNTPMKIYSYLASGKPILATDILSHTQVLDPSWALLVDPTPEGLADGLGRLVDDPGLRKRLGEAGSALAAAHYTYDAFKRKVSCAYDTLCSLDG